MDYSSPQKGGVGIVLTNPYGSTVSLSFKSSNNEVKYEALIIRLFLVSHHSLSFLCVHGNPCLVPKKLISY